jgi:glycosyltransferase involved in cell wall biosynthesis
MIPHGVDTDWFYPRDERHPAVDEEKTTLLYVGRLGARKGLDLASRALAEVDDERVEFLIAGTGRHEETLRELARELGIADRVRLLGYVPDEDLPVLYSSADVFVLPSRYEGFGLVLLEAMACGTPVIGADAGGIPTAVSDGEYGRVVERDISELADAMYEFSNDDTPTSMRSNAISASRSLDWEKSIRKVEEIYRRNR